jgi:hypothetical protein
MAEHEGKKNEVTPKTPAPKTEPPKLEGLTAKAEAAGHRDDPDVALARDQLSRMPKKEEKNASHKG